MIYNDELNLKFPTGVYLTDPKTTDVATYIVRVIIRKKSVMIGTAVVARGNADFYRTDAAREGAPRKAWRALVATLTGRSLPFDVESIRVPLPGESDPQSM